MLLARVKAFNEVQDAGAALPLAEQALELARRSGHKPTEARALFERAFTARVGWAKTRLDQIEEWLHQAAATAQEGRDDGVAADAFIMLSFQRGFELGNQAEGELWSRYAEAAIVRLGGDDFREASATAAWPRST